MDHKNSSEINIDGAKTQDEKMQLLINELQLLFAEKRTALSVLRTGIAVFALPLSVISVLIATSELYSLNKVMNLFVPVIILCAALVILGIYLIVRALLRLHKIDDHINRIKKKSPLTNKLVP
jgi:uncharacterized membrane protein YidH (DUF202 family)